MYAYIKANSARRDADRIPAEKLIIYDDMYMDLDLLLKTLHYGFCPLVKFTYKTMTNKDDNDKHGGDMT